MASCKSSTKSWVVSTLAGIDIVGIYSGGYHDATGTEAQFADPTGVAVDSFGNLYVADTDNNRIRKITPTGEVTTIAGSSQGHHDATGTEAQFRYPSGVAMDSSGNVYVADKGNTAYGKSHRQGR